MISQQLFHPRELVARLRRHWIIGLLLCIAAGLLFTNLHREYLWEDEGDTAVLARSILYYGVPKAWDGVTFSDSDLGKRLNNNLVMVSHPWLQYYVTAASFLFLGETTLAARVPFAVCGLATILLAYALVLRQTGSLRTAVSAAALLTLSVQFLLYSRQCRNYSLNALLTLFLIWQFYRLTTRRQALWFALMAILLFHTHPIGLAPIAALGAATLFYKPFRPFRRGFWEVIPLVALFTLPWIYLAKTGYTENTTLAGGWHSFLPRLSQFAIECASVTPLVAIVVLLHVLWLRRSKADSTQGTEENSLLVVIAMICVFYTGVFVLTQSRRELWEVGLRYAPAIIPFAMMAAAILVSKVSGKSWKVWLTLMLLLGFTKMGRVTPWAFWHEPKVTFNPNRAVTFHVPPSLVDRIFRTGQVDYVKSLFRENPGTVANICRFLKENGKEQDILITNYSWEPLYFHTRMPQGLKILPDYPIYEAARDHGLPDYVFNVEGARWIVWRRAWGAYRGYDGDTLLQQLEKAGAKIALVSSIPETVWENRENIHFRRFAENDYNYDWYDNLPDALIFRVDWANSPQGSQNGG